MQTFSNLEQCSSVLKYVVSVTRGRVTEALVVVSPSCSLVYVCMLLVSVQDSSVRVSTCTEDWSDFLPRVDSKERKSTPLSIEKRACIANYLSVSTCACPTSVVNTVILPLATELSTLHAAQKYMYLLYSIVCVL